MEEICKLKDIYKMLYKFEKEFAENNGITINEGMLLCCLKDGKPKTAADLCEFIGLSNSRVSKVIFSIEEKGYINREMGKIDKRQMIFSLTKEGKNKIKEMKSHSIDFNYLVISVQELLSK